MMVHCYNYLHFIRKIIKAFKIIFVKSAVQYGCPFKRAAVQVTGTDFYFSPRHLRTRISGAWLVGRRGAARDREPQYARSHDPRVYVTCICAIISQRDFLHGFLVNFSWYVIWPAVVICSATNWKHDCATDLVCSCFVYTSYFEELEPTSKVNYFDHTDAIGIQCSSTPYYIKQ